MIMIVITKQRFHLRNKIKIEKNDVLNIKYLGFKRSKVCIGSTTIHLFFV